MFEAQTLVRADLRTAAILSAFVYVATSLISFVSLTNPLGFSAIAYIGYIAIIPCVAIGWFHPLAAIVASFILLAVNPGYPVPHTIGSAPSDYLIVTATVSLLIKTRFDVRNYGPPAVAAALVVLSALLALGLALGGMYMAPADKSVLAEVLGLISMSCYLLAPSLVIRSAGDIRLLATALAIGCLVLIATGLLGGADTIMCMSTGVREMYTTAGFRNKGLLGDPNMFGVYVAALSPILIFALFKRHFLLSLAASLVCSGLIITSGSRTAIAIGCISAVASLCLVRKNRLLMIPAYVSMLIVLAFAPKVAWSHLPCLINAPEQRVLFDERNDATMYFARLMFEGNGAEKLLQESSALRDDCLGSPDKSPPKGSLAKSAQLRECIIKELQSQMQKPEVSTNSYKSTPWVSALLSKLPLDDHRRKLWEHAISLGMENPAFGIGLSNLTHVTPNGWRSHNTLTTTFAEQGFVGVVLLVAALTIALVSGVTAFKKLPPELSAIFSSALIGAIVSVIGSLSQDMIRQPITWALIGFVAAAHCFRKAVPGSYEHNTRAS